MKKNNFFLLTFTLLLFCSSVSATVTFDVDTSLGYDNTEYVFAAGETFQNIDIPKSQQKVVIDGVYSLRFFSDSHDLLINVYQWDGLNNHLFGISTSYPRNVSFELYAGATRYYLKTNGEYYYDQLAIDGSEQLWTLALPPSGGNPVGSGGSSGTPTGDVTGIVFSSNNTINRTDSFFTSLFSPAVVFEMPTLSSTSEYVGGRIIKITWFWIVLLITIIIIYLLWLMFGRRRRRR